MKRYGVLVVDDSSFMRKCISLIIERNPQFFTIGTAGNGKDAIEKVKNLKPDIVTMDVEMPGMNGIDILKEIMKISSVPVVMLSNHTEENTSVALEALGLGALDFFSKGVLVGEDVKYENINEFLNRLKIIVESEKPMF
ncbi:response regulator [Clostridium sp. PL3]|uniref:Response regulator n=1 Tax=Clostridium thailandense TaxID=2794346 RepID=A0A949WV81_9CLOT|nr:response regulator [Clostridium thailandense]MBV7273382.1 response regulator [Clostridium thailandense]